MKAAVCAFIFLCCALNLDAQYKISSAGDSLKPASENFDVSLFRSINNNRSGISDFIVPPLDRAAFIYAVSVPPVLFTLGRAGDFYYDENSGVLSALSLVSSEAVSFAFKYIAKRERPFRVMDNVYYNDKNSPTDHYSFPSGHTTAAFSLAASLTMRYPDNPILIAGLYLHALAIGYGRVYLGVHYPTDVIGGMLIGTGSAILINSLRKEIIHFKNSVFTENSPDFGSSRANQYIILGTILTSDIVGYFLSRSEIIKHTSLEPSYNGLKFTYRF